MNNKQDVFCYRVTFHYKLAFKLNIEQTWKDGMVVQIKAEGKNNKKVLLWMSFNVYKKSFLHLTIIVQLHMTNQNIQCKMHE